MARLHILPIVVLLMLAVSGATGCERLRAERKNAEATRAAVAAIQRYSTASDAANQAHRGVMAAFDKANRSPNLPEYKNALRTQVLPAMDAFIARLRTMPADTAELKAIHAQLVDAYEQARREIDDYEKSLDSAEGLGRFADIRDHLQQRVKAYREALARFYSRYRRELRLDAGPEAAALPGQASATAALPAAATP